MPLRRVIFSSCFGRGICRVAADIRRVWPWFKPDAPAYVWIRPHGKAAFEDNMAAKGMCIANPIVKG